MSYTKGKVSVLGRFVGAAVVSDPLQGSANAADVVAPGSCPPGFYTYAVSGAECHDGVIVLDLIVLIWFLALFMGSLFVKSAVIIKIMIVNFV